jgi:AAA15 family ATPase/GTPase
MIKNFTIKNFRCFKELKVEGLSRINLITGQNNVGKTALLEALVLILSCDSVAGTIELDKYRGISKKGQSADEIWGWLFYQHQLNETIKFHLENKVYGNSIQHEIALALSASQPVLTNINVESVSSATESSIINSKELNQLLITYKNSRNEKFEIKGDVTARGVQSTPTSKTVFPSAIYINNTRPPNPTENAQLFDRIVLEGKKKDIIKVMQLIEPRLLNIESLAPYGIHQLYGDIGFSPQISLNYLGDGLNKLISILLLIATVPQGSYFFIDEMENGFHYSVMPTVWKIIAEFAEKYDVQIIATTHSREFLQAAYEMNQGRIEENKDSLFTLYRLQCIDQNIEVVHIKNKNIETALEFGLELR